MSKPKTSTLTTTKFHSWNGTHHAQINVNKVPKTYSDTNVNKVPKTYS